VTWRQVVARLLGTTTLTLHLAGGTATAQGYDPRTHASPLRLLEGPADPEAYYRMRTRTAALVSQGEAAPAEPLAEQLVRAYPRDGENWLLLARARRAAGKHADAALAYERAGRILGWGAPSDIGLELARSHAAAGDREATLRALHEEFAVRGSYLNRNGTYSEPAFAAFRSDAEFRRILGQIDTSGWSHDDGWAHDLGARQVPAGRGATRPRAPRAVWCVGGRPTWRENATLKVLAEP
jgi:tetratricopeptide (TPR) repeat protein